MLEDLEIIIKKIIENNRICKIRYSCAFGDFLKNRVYVLGKKYNLYSITDLLYSTEKPSHMMENRFKELCVGLFKNLLGLTPTVGVGFTVIFSAMDVIQYFTLSDLECLKRKINLRERSYKKFKKIKNIIFIENASYLSPADCSKVQFIRQLIEYKYLPSTLLIICEPENFPVNIQIDTDSTYELLLTKSLLKREFQFVATTQHITLLNVLGIEYIEAVKKISIEKTIQNNQQLIEEIINDMIEKCNYKTPESLHDFLKLCSLLFDNFNYEDAEYVSGIKNIDCETNIKGALDTNLLCCVENCMPSEYKFLLDNLRIYYQKHAMIMQSSIRKQIMEYLVKKYPMQYTNLALISVLAINDEIKIVSHCLKAYYYERELQSLYKVERIKNYLTNSNYLLVQDIVELNDRYTQLSYKDNDTKSLYKEALCELQNTKELSSEDKLICLSYISRVAYELSDSEELLKLDLVYRKTFRDLKISSTYEQYYRFILDYIVFSTSIENNYATTKTVQRMMNYLNKINLPIIDNIKLCRLGNVIYSNDIEKGLDLTRSAYEMSKNYIFEHKYATINYSCSLGICGYFELAKKILYNEFKKKLKLKNIISFSARNNYIIVLYFSKNPTRNWLVDSFSSLQAFINGDNFSDAHIVNNNLLAAYIETDINKYMQKILDMYEYILSNTNDIYHNFFLHQNMMIYYFLLGDRVNLLKQMHIYVIPGLLATYEEFFLKRDNFLVENVDNHWDIYELKKHMLKWGQCYYEKKYTIYKNPVLFGFIERWFE